MSRPKLLDLFCGAGLANLHTTRPRIAKEAEKIKD